MQKMYCVLTTQQKCSENATNVLSINHAVKTQGMHSVLILCALHSTIVVLQYTSEKYIYFIGFSTTFLGGLSLHLNHLIGSRVTNYDWQFGTLPFGLFGSNLDTMGLETYPRTYSGQF